MSRALIALALTSLVLPACGQPEEDLVPLSGRPTTEQVIARYLEMLDELVAGLDAELGVRPWVVAGGDERLDWASCADDAVNVHLPSRVLAGRYAEDPAPVLDRVLERHGFGGLGVSVGERTTIRRATDELGGSVELLEGSATVLSVRTGCHRSTGPLGDLELPGPAGAGSD